MGLEGIGGMAGGMVGTAFGGPVGGMIGGMAGNMLEGLFGGDKKGGDVGSLTGLLGGGGQSLGGGGGIQPELASKALQLFDEAKTPQEKMKLLDVAILALGGKPGQMPSAMGGANGTGGGTSPSTDSTGSANASPSSTSDTDSASGADSTDETSPASNSGGSNSPLKVDGNSVDTGRYKITASTDKEGQVKIFDKQTNSFVEAYGDPHLVTSDGDKAAFQKNGVSIKLPDGTQVHMKPTAINDKGVSYLQGAMVEKDGKAVTMTGMHDGSGKVTTSGVENASNSLRGQYMTQGQTVLKASNGDVGDLFMTDPNGHKTTELTSPDKETNLDGSGGSLGQAHNGSDAGETNGTSSNGTSASNGTQGNNGTEGNKGAQHGHHHHHHHHHHKAGGAGGNGSGGTNGSNATGGTQPHGSSFGFSAPMLEKMSQIMHLSASNVQSPQAQGDIMKGLQSALDAMMQDQ